MLHTKNAIGNLVNRYRAVLKKCHLMNTFGSLVVAGMLTLGGVALSSGQAEANVNFPLSTDAYLIEVDDGTSTYIKEFSVTDSAGTTTDYGMLLKGNPASPDQTYGTVADLVSGIITGTTSIVTGEHAFSSISIGDATDYTFWVITKTPDGLDGPDLYFKVLDAGGATISSINSRITTPDANISTNVVSSTTTDNGGALINDGNTINSITHSAFIDNRVLLNVSGETFNGGAIANVSGTIHTISNSAFIGNVAIGNGGAVYNIATITNLGGTYTANKASKYGGAVCNTNGATITNLDGAYTGNNATLGGAVYNNGSITNLNGLYTGNTASEHGGAVFNIGTITSLGGTYTANAASQHGGAVFNAEYGTITNLGGTYTSNYAQYGGAVRNEGIITIFDGIFTGNTANYGGAVHNTHNIDNLSGIFTSNHGVTNAGGAVYNDALAEITNLSGIFTSNSGNQGGAVHNYKDAVITNLGGIFTSNSGGQGGAVFNNENAVITNLSGTFTYNSASLGGAVFNNGVITNLSGIFTNNNANNTAGAVHNSNFIESLRGTFTGNSALLAGAVANTGTINFIAATPTAAGLTLFSGNTATNDLGAVVSNAIHNNHTVNFNAGMLGVYMGIIDVQDAITGNNGTLNINGAVTNTDGAAMFAPTDGFVMLDTVTGNDLIVNNGSLSFADGDIKEHFDATKTFTAESGSIVYVDVDLLNNKGDTITAASGEMKAGSTIAYRVLGAFDSSISSSLEPLTSVFTGVTGNQTYSYAFSNTKAYTPYGDGTYSLNTFGPGNFALSIAVEGNGANITYDPTAETVRTFSLTDDYPSSSVEHAMFSDNGTVTMFGNLDDALAEPLDDNKKYGTKLYSIDATGKNILTVENADATLNIIDMYIKNANTAITNKSGTVVVYNSIFEGNDYAIAGSDTGGSIHVFSSSFINNTTNAISAWDGTTLQLDNVHFSGNAHEVTGSGLAGGGALFLNGGTATFISGSFTGNSVTNLNSGLARGGAIYAGRDTQNISADFLNNYAIADNGVTADGGAIFASRGLGFVADGAAYTISGNYTSQDGGTTKAYNAIFFNNPGYSLDFTLNNGGSYTLNDNVRARDGVTYTVNINGNGSHNTLNLNNALYGASAVNLTSATLNLGKTTHGSEEFSGSIGFVPLTVTSGQVNIGVGTNFLAPVTLQSGSLMHVDAGRTTFQNTVSVDSTSAIDFSGADILAQITSFGTVDFSAASGENFSLVSGLAGAVIADNTSSLEFMVGGGGVIHDDAVIDNLRSEIATELLGNDALASIITFDGYATWSTASLDNIDQDYNKSTATIGAGTLDHVGETVFAAIRAGTSTITGAGVNLTLTGQDETGGDTNQKLTNGPLTISNGAKVTLGTENSPSFTYVDGDITVTGENSTLVTVARVNTDTHTVTLNENADLLVNSHFEIPSLTRSNTSQVNLVGGNLNYINAVSFSTADFATAPTDGKIFIDATSILQSEATITLTDSGTISLIDGARIGVRDGLTLAGDTTVTTGTLYVRGTLDASTPGTFTIDGDGALRTEGDLTTEVPLVITNGVLGLSTSHSTLTATEDITFGADGMLSSTSGSSFDFSNVTLTANMENFGTVSLNDFTFYTTGAVDGDLVANALSSFVLNSDSGGILLDADIATLKDNIATALFGDSTLVDIITLNSYRTLSDATLGTITEDINYSEATIGAGTLNASQKGLFVSFGGIAADPYDASVVDSIVNVGPNNATKTVLSLTGLGTANKALTQGSLTVNMAENATGQGFELYLGNVASNTTLNGNLTLHSSNSSYAHKQATVYINQGKKVTIDGDMTLTKGALVHVDGIAGSSLEANNITVGETGATQASAIHVGEAGANTYIQVMETLDIKDMGVVSIANGSVIVADFNLADTGQLIIGSDPSISQSSSFTVQNDLTLDVADFAITADSTGVAGKIALGESDTFSVLKTLTLTGGGTLDLSSRSLYTYGLTLDAPTTFKGFLNLNDDKDNATTQMLKGELTITAGSIGVSGTWATDSPLHLAGGYLRVVGAEFDVSAGLSTTADNVYLADNSTLIAKLSDFGIVDLSQAQGSYFDDANANVASFVNYATGAGVTLELLTDDASSPFTYASDATITALVDEMKTDIFDSYFTGTIDISDAFVSASGVTLSTVAGNFNLPNETIGAGDLTYAGNTVAASITGYTASTVSGAGVNLTLTGQDGAGGNTNSHLTQQGITVSNGASLTLGSAEQSQDSLIFNGSLTVNASSLTVDSDSIVAQRVGDAVTLTNNAHLNIANGGELKTLSSFSFDDTSTVTVNNSTGGAYTSILLLNDNYALNASQFSATGEAGKLTIGASGSLDVEGTLTVNTNTVGQGFGIADGGEIWVVDGFDFGANGATLTGGNLVIATNGAASIQGALTINNAESRLRIGNNHATEVTTTTDVLTVQKGSVSLEVGTFATGADITFGDEGTLYIASYASLDIANDTLTANMANFGSVSIAADFSATFTADTSKVAQDTITGNNATQLVLNNYGGTGDLLNQSEYNALMASIAEHLFNNASYADQITVSGIGIFQTLDSFDPAATGANTPIGAGTYTHADNAVFSGIVDNRTGTATSKDSVINSPGHTLYLTGNGPVPFSQGSITVNQGGLYLGFDSTTITQGGTLEGDLIVDKQGSESAIAAIIGNVTIAGDIEIKNGGLVKVDPGTTFNAQGGITVDGTGSQFHTSVNMTVSSLALTNGGSVSVEFGKTLTVQSAVALAGGNMSTGNGTLEAAGFTNNTADLTINLGGSLKTTNGMSNTKAVTIDVGSFELAGGDWVAGADVTVKSGTLSVSAGTMDTSNVTLSTTAGAATINVAQGAQLTVDADAFGSIGSDGSFDNSSRTIADATMNNNGTVLLANIGFTTMTKSANAKLQANTDWQSIVGASSGTFTLDGVALSGLYSLTWVVENDQFSTDNIMAGTLDGQNVTAAGIVKNSDDASTASFVAASSTLTLTGNNTGNILLDEGSLETSGLLNLGSASVASTNFNGALSVKSGGVANTLSSVTFAEAVTVESGSQLNIQAGTVDVTKGLTADAAALSSVAGTTLVVDKATIGSNAAGIVTASSATVTGTSGNTLAGNVTITGFDAATLDYNTDYQTLQTAAKNAYGTGGSITLLNVTPETTEATLSDVGARQDTSLRNNTVQAGDMAPGHVAVIGAIRQSTTGQRDVTNDSGQLTVTGQATDGITPSGVVSEGSVTTTGTGISFFGNAQGISTMVSSFNTGSGIVSHLNILAEGTIGNDGTGTTNVQQSSAQTMRSTGGGLLAIRPGTSMTENFIGDATSFLDIGSILDTLRTILIAKNVTLNGLTALHDPAWVDGVSIEGASAGVYQNFTNGIDGKVVAGQNAFMVFGDVDTAWAEQTFNDSGITWGQSATTAALFIKQPQTLDASLGAVAVDGTVTDRNVAQAYGVNTATFGANSLLVVDANDVTGVGTNAALTATVGTLSVDASSKLHIVDGKDRQVVTVMDGFSNASSSVTDGGWGYNEDLKNLTNLTLSSSSLSVDSATWDAATGAYEVTLKVIFDPAMYGPYMQTATGDYLNTMTRDATGIDTNSVFSGRQLLSRALSEDYGMGLLNPKLSVATIEGAAQLAGAANVAANAMNAVKAATGAVVARNSLTDMGDNASKPVVMSANGAAPAVEGQNIEQKLGLGVWLMPLYRWNNSDGFSAGNLSHGADSNLGGIALGMDYTHAVADDTTLRYGLALNVGAGDSESTGDFNATDNDFDFWGVTAYGALQKGNFVGTLDFGYSEADHKVSQSLPTSMAMGGLSADMSSQIISAGLNLEYTFNTKYMDVTPHAGARFMHVSVDDYHAQSGNTTAVNSSVEDQNLWVFPVGVTFSKDIVTDNGWMFTPKADVGFIAAAGDTETQTSSAFTGVQDTLHLAMDNVDGFAFNGGLGFELSNEASGVSLGLDYTIQASDNETGHMIFANFKYEF